MPIAIHQKTSATYQIYPSQDTLVVDPFGNETLVPVNQNSKAYSQQIATATDPFDRTTVLAKIAAKQMSGPMRNRGDGSQWDTYDIGFMPDEVDTDAKRQAAYDAVKSWAGNFNVKGNIGTRMFTIQEWHDDGSKPHLRVDINRVIYTSQTTVNPLGPRDAGGINKDLENLDKVLQAAGFDPMDRGGVARDGTTMTPTGTLQPGISVAQQVITTLTEEQDDLTADDLVDALSDDGTATPTATASTPAQASTGKVPYALQNLSNKDLLQQRSKELKEQMAESLAEYKRIQAAIDIEQKNRELEATNTQLETDNRDLNLSLNDLASTTWRNLAQRDPEFGFKISELPAAELIKAGLEKHEEIETQLQTDVETLQSDLATRMAELDQVVQELGTTKTELAEIDEALGQYFEKDELAQLEGKSAFEKVDALGEKLTKQVENTAGQLRAKTEEWISTNKELLETRADRDAKDKELNTAKADIDGAIALLRNDMPELFKNNPDLEKSMRASMEAAIKHTKTVEQERDDLASKLQETEAAKEQLEEQNDALLNQNKELKTDLEKMQDERDEARKQLADVTAKLEETTKRVQTLEKVEGNIRNLLKREREEGWQSMSAEEAIETLTRKYDDISRDKNTAASQVEFYKEEITGLRAKVDKLEERLDEQRRETQEQLAKQQQAHTQQIAELVKGQVGQNQGNVPTQGGQPKTTPTQGPTGNPPQTKGPSISEE